MTTRGAMKTEIMDDMKRSSAADGVRVLSAISSAIKFYQPKRFFFNESRDTTFNTVASTNTYTWAAVGAEFYTVDGVFLTDGSIIELRKEDYRAFETPITGESVPTAWAFMKGGIIFWPTPPGIYAVRVTGHLKLAEPAADDTAANEWFTEAYELIRCRAKAYLYAHVFTDLEMAQVMGVAEKEAKTSLMGATASKVGTGRLVPTEF